MKNFILLKVTLKYKNKYQNDENMKQNFDFL